MSTAESEPAGTSGGMSGEAAGGSADGRVNGATGETGNVPANGTTTGVSQKSAKSSQAYDIRTRQIAASKVHRGREGQASPLIYAATRLVAALLIPLLVDLRVEGREHLPRSGAVVLASDRIASVDIPLVAFPVPRMVHYMAKANFFQPPLIGGFIRRVGAFPVRRGEGDRESLRICERLLSKGKVVGIFPEGHRSEQHALIEAHPGVGLIALRADAPVIRRTRHGRRPSPARATSAGCAPRRSAHSARSRRRPASPLRPRGSATARTACRRPPGTRSS